MRAAAWAEVSGALPYQLKNPDRERVLGLLKRIWVDDPDEALKWLNASNEAIRGRPTDRPRDMLAADELSVVAVIDHLRNGAENQRAWRP
jgi:hypothetical protein